MKFFFACIAFAGHFAIGTIVINRLHSTALPYWFIKILDAIWVFWHLVAPAIWIVWLVDPAQLGDIWPLFHPIIYFHLIVCAIAAVSLLPGWIHRALTRQMSDLQLSNDTRIVDISQQLGGLPIPSKLIRLQAQLPWNEIMALHVTEKKLAVPQLPESLAEMTITHLSDLHFTGDISAEFHEEVVRQANQLASDLIVITGDIIDKSKCLPWLSDILGALHAEHGVYFVLGNHDVRVGDEDEVRSRLKGAGLIDLGGQWIQIRLRQHPIVLAGNELPWFLPAANMSDCPPPAKEGGPFRILLSHAPDQIEWAKRNDIDLMLAGHTHGGQIQLPILGPVLSPSCYGVRYASGSFFERPTLMHVSRGVSGTRHIRYQAPPELAKLILFPGGAVSDDIKSSVPNH